jgi:hypothetical protein
MALRLITARILAFVGDRETGRAPAPLAGKVSACSLLYIILIAAP